MRGDPRELKRKKQTGKFGFRFILSVQIYLKMFFLHQYTHNKAKSVGFFLLLFIKNIKLKFKTF